MTRLYACLGSGNCYKPWLAMQQIGRPFDLALVDVLTGQQKSPDYLAVNPLGVVPYLVTPDGTGIGESNAMLWYVSEGTALMPQTAADRAQALQWMFFEQSKLEPLISPARYFTTILPHMADEKADAIRTWQQQACPGLDRLNAHLDGRGFMLDCGYCLADIAVFGYVHVMEEAGLPLSDYPAIAAWIGRVAGTQGFLPLSHLGRSEREAAA